MRQAAFDGRGLGLAAVLAGCAVAAGCTEAHGPSTPEARARFVTLVRSLESDPLGENASAIRQRLRDWALGVPDIRFKVCPGLLGDGLANYRYSREIDLQVLLSGAVLTIENPGKARDNAAVYSAGVDGALRAYHRLVSSTPDAHSAVLDALVEKRDRGELFGHIAGLARERCPKSRALWIAAPAGAAAGLVLALLVSRLAGARGASRQAELTRRNDITPRHATTLRSVVLTCAAYYLLVGIALHLLEPEYDPRFNFMSDYAWGAYGWLMTTTFFVLGVAILAVAIGVRDVHQSSLTARVGVGLLIVGAVFVCLAGVFRRFPLHDVASAVAIPSLLMAALLLSWSFRTAERWEAVHQATFLISIGMFAAFLSMVADIGMPGLQQRAFLFLFLSWLSIVVHRLVRMTASPVPRSWSPTP